MLAEIADGAGGVVLGRAAAMVLGDRRDALHVRLDGSRDRRLAAAVLRSGRSEDEVRREMEAADRSREAYVRHFYRCDPGEARHYHLVIDSTAAAAGHRDRADRDGGPRPGHRPALSRCRRLCADVEMCGSLGVWASRRKTQTRDSPGFAHAKNPGGR